MRMIGASLIWSFRILGFGVKGKRTSKKHILSAVGIVALSVTPIIVSIFLANGMTIGITRKYINLSSFHAQIRTNMLDDKIEDEILQDPICKGIYHVRESFSILYSKDSSCSTTIKGVDPEYLQSNSFNQEIEILSGSNNLADGADIMISAAIAKELDVTINDTIAVVTITQQMGQTRLKPAIFHVKGIFASGYNQLDKQLVFIDLKQSSRIIKDDTKEYVGVIVRDAYAEDVTSIRRTLAKYVTDKSIIITWDQLNRSLYSNFRSSKTILYLVMVLIIIVASINISSTCIIIIQEKYHEIGMLKAMGVSSRVIKSTFLYTSMFIGGLGALIGISAGIVISTQLHTILLFFQSLGLSALDFYLVDIPVIFHWNEIVLVGVTAIVLAGLSALLPLKRINIILPINILQE